MAPPHGTERAIRRHTETMLIFRNPSKTDNTALLLSKLLDHIHASQFRDPRQHPLMGTPLIQANGQRRAGALFLPPLVDLYAVDLHILGLHPG